MSIVGQPQIISLPEVNNPDDAESRRLQLFPPGDAAPVPIDIPFGGTQVVAKRCFAIRNLLARGAGKNIGFSVNLTASTTSTERIESAKLDQWFGPGSYDLVSNQDEIEIAEIRSASRVSLRSPLMLLALAVFLLEQVLANRFYRSRGSRSGHTVIRSAQQPHDLICVRKPIYGSILVAIAATAAVMMVVVIFAPPTASPTQRRWLIALRSVAALSLLLVVYRPSVIRTDNRPADATLVVAVELSHSMTLPDSEESDRWTTQVKAWRQLAEGLRQFEATLNLQLVGYDRTARAMPSAALEALDDIQPEGDLTDVSAGGSVFTPSCRSESVGRRSSSSVTVETRAANRQQPRRSCQGSDAGCPAFGRDFEFDGCAVLGDPDWTGRRRVGDPRCCRRWIG